MVASTLNSSAQASTREHQKLYNFQSSTRAGVRRLQLVALFIKKGARDEQSISFRGGGGVSCGATWCRKVSRLCGSLLTQSLHGVLKLELECPPRK